MASIQSGRSCKTTKSDTNQSVQSMHSNASEKQYNDEEPMELGPIVMIDIIITNHIHFMLSCYQLSMASKLLNNLEFIIKSKKETKKEQIFVVNKKEKEEEIINDDDINTNQGWFSWVGSFFYDSEEEKEGMNKTKHQMESPSDCILIKFQSPSITFTLINSRETSTNTMISMNRRKKKKKYQFTKLYKKQSPTKKSSISRGSSVSSNNSFNLYGNAQSVRSKTYAVTQYTFAEIKCDDINIHLSLPWTSNNNHKSLILTVGTLYLFNFRDNQPLPVIVWGDQQTVTDSFPFILKQKK